jgi:hypothetical protein
MEIVDTIMEKMMMNGWCPSLFTVVGWRHGHSIYDGRLLDGAAVHHLCGVADDTNLVYELLLL